MKEKQLSDIRVFRSDIPNIDGNSLPSTIDNKPLHITIHRIVMKLRESGFSLGEFDHLYINFTTCAIDGGMALSERSADRYHPWYRYYDVRVSEDMFSQLGTSGISIEVAKLIEKVLIQNFATDVFNENQIRSCFDQALEQGEKMLMKFKEKVTAKRKAVIYLRFLDSGRYLPLLRVLDTDGKVLFEADLPETLDLSYLGDIQVSAEKVTVKPRKNAFSKDLQPLSFEY